MNEIHLNYDVSKYETDLIEEYNQNVKLYNSQKTINETVKVAFSRNKEISAILEQLDTLNEDIMFEMANFEKKYSGLSCDIWIDEAGSERETSHNFPRVKVQDPKDSKNRVPVKIDRYNPVILAGSFTNQNENINDIFEFIKKHYFDLMKVWNRKKSAYWFIEKYRI